MQSIVTAVDDPHREWLEEAAGEIKAVTGRKDLAAATRPHVTLHVADSYVPAVEPALAGLAAKAAPLTFRTGEIGVFHGPQVVVALQVLRSDPLVRFQQRVAKSVTPHALDPKPAYAPETWAPHITIVAGRIDAEHIDSIITVLARRTFEWQIPLTNICLIPAHGAHEWTRFDLPARTDSH